MATAVVLDAHRSTESLKNIARRTRYYVLVGKNGKAQELILQITAFFVEDEPLRTGPRAKDAREVMFVDGSRHGTRVERERAIPAEDVSLLGPRVVTSGLQKSGKRREIARRRRDAADVVRCKIRHDATRRRCPILKLN